MTRRTLEPHAEAERGQARFHPVEINGGSFFSAPLDSNGNSVMLPTIRLHTLLPFAISKPLSSRSGLSSKPFEGAGLGKPAHRGLSPSERGGGGGIGGASLKR